ncbi:Mam33 family protein [Schizosaccharomyces japonicus yFS275]|uniref:Mam33 family protein n=1 Tax=Schizosaccharomyces japonicus (strain yFS275 / FY16936) TaxID=402676 RepID=B6K3H1_SCHJY|nr:Mam33 family protein [Schizosaccharomyces japonicus yFS275]EEB08028.1 Mam33 family protein [Schizosaccharomyces japonicus yFS275]
MFSIRRQLGTQLGRVCLRSRLLTVNVPLLSHGIVRKNIHVIPKRFASSEATPSLPHALKNEILFEKKFLKKMEGSVDTAKFTKTTGFTVKDVPGQAEVVLERSYGPEKIEVKFNVQNFYDEEGDMYPDEEEEDLEYENESNNLDENQDEIIEDYEDETSEDIFHTQPCTISITKPNSGCLYFDANIVEGELDIDNIYFSKDPELLLSSSEDAKTKRKTAYLGPSFKELDEEVQSLFENYLEERGIDYNLIDFVMQMKQPKETKEYVHWLQNIQKFVSN